MPPISYVSVLLDEVGYRYRADIPVVVMFGNLRLVSRQLNLFVREFVRNFYYFKKFMLITPWIFHQYTDVKTIKLVGDGGPVIRFCLENLTNLTSLELGCNQSICDNSIMKLTNLTSLTFYRNILISDESLKLPTKLKALRFSSQNRRISDVVLSRLTNLTDLCLANNDFSYKALKPLTNLTTLDLIGNTNMRVED